MSDDFGKELLMLGGTIAGFVAALLTVLEKLLDFQTRMHGKKEAKGSSRPERAVPESTTTIDFFSSKPLRGSSYLLLYETSVIVPAGVMLNYVGLTLSRHMESILFLDMPGPALAAFLLGPWWGAIVALLSNSVVNWLLYPEAGAQHLVYGFSVFLGGLISIAQGNEADQRLAFRHAQKGLDLSFSHEGRAKPNRS